MNWRSRKSVALLIGAICAGVFVADAATAYFGRDSTVCRDGRQPVAQTSALFGQRTTIYCHDGQVVTLYE